MVCNRFVYHEDLTTLALRSYYVLQVPTTSLLRFNSTRPRHVSFEHVQNLTKTFTSIKTSLRPYYVPLTSNKTLPRPYRVENVARCRRNMSLSRIMRKLDFCLCENKGVDQLRSNCEADQRLCFCHSDSTITHLPENEISSF